VRVSHPFLTLSAVALLAGCATARPSVDPARASLANRRLAQSIIPAPSSVQMSPADSFRITDSVRVAFTAPAGADVVRIAGVVVSMLSPWVTGPAQSLDAGIAAPRATIRLALSPRADSLGSEGYTLVVTSDSVRLEAREPAGLFHGVQSLRQLLPVAVEHRAGFRRRLVVPGTLVSDAPRFVWRGAMLDVARHFFGVDDVKRYIDVMALYKLNRLHLHLTDDQGWRIEIKSWPALATVGGSREVGGGVGGHYTQAQYAELVAYAQERYITIVPEIEMPGHINAALSAIPALNCDGVAKPVFTGITVGFSAVCAASDTVYSILTDVIREVAALTPGPYFHIGGDEVGKLGHAPYLRFVERMEPIVRAQGKRMIGWDEMSTAQLDTTSIVQHWRYSGGISRDSSFVHAARGGQVIASPGAKTYFDMKYDSSTVLGLRWAGIITVRDAYDWEPGTLLPGVAEPSVLGVEAPLWSETVETISDVEYLAFPRLLAMAEVGWSMRARRGWDDFRLRLAEHGPRLQALGVNFYRSPEVVWRW
jgi:hexosaminidase